jgi:hypothetical protein
MHGVEARHVLGHRHLIEVRRRRDGRFERLAPINVSHGSTLTHPRPLLRPNLQDAPSATTRISP